MRPLERRKSGKMPLVSCSVPKKFTSMHLRNVATGDSSTSATTSLKPALLTRPHKPEGMEQGEKLWVSSAASLQSLPFHTHPATPLPEEPCPLTCAGGMGLGELQSTANVGWLAQVHLQQP